jgi:glycolate oxidase iron-sulfur subunit
VNRATVRVLRANDFSVSAPSEQVCCGALHAHAGDLEGARRLAQRNIAAFDSAAPVITNAGGCGAMLVTYGHLFANDKTLAEPAADFSARVRDVSQQLATKEMRTAPPGAERNKVTYDTSCHLLYGQRNGEASESMVRNVAGDNFVALDGTERCCGAAGVYNLLQPEMSQFVLQEKLDHVRQTRASVLATGNPGCQMHIGAGAGLAGMKLKTCHPIEMVDQAYEQAGLYEEA